MSTECKPVPDRRQFRPASAQSLLNQLAVFSGGFNLQRVEPLVAPDRADQVIEHLDILVERSPFSRQPGAPPRYRMLEITRAFALEALQALTDGVDWASRLARAMAQLFMNAARGRDRCVDVE